MCWNSIYEYYECIAIISFDWQPWNIKIIEISNSFTYQLLTEMRVGFCVVSIIVVWF